MGEVLSQSSEKAKNFKSRECGATFTKLGAFLYDREEGVYLTHKSETKSFDLES